MRQRDIPGNQVAVKIARIVSFIRQPEVLHSDINDLGRGCHVGRRGSDVVTTLKRNRI